MMVNPTEEANRSFLPIPKESLLTHASTNHRIEVAMGHVRLSPPINTEDLELDWHLFELTIMGEELSDQQQQSTSKSHTTKFKELQIDMAPKMHGSVNDATKDKSRTIAEAKRKEAKEEKKLSTL
jgi:hypothetical protein